jgi:hypothetical protein
MRRNGYFSFSSKGKRSISNPGEPGRRGQVGEIEWIPLTKRRKKLMKIGFVVITFDEFF